jgi:stage II sporulation protein AA (anti-sigma F factor antagonist)
MFEIRVAPDGQVFVSGRLDAAESEHARTVFRGLSRPTTVDCAALDYISSAGIAVIIEAYKRLSGGGHALRLVNVTPRVKNVFVYAGLDKLLGIA